MDARINRPSVLTALALQVLCVLLLLFPVWSDQRSTGAEGVSTVDVCGPAVLLAFRTPDPGDTQAEETRECAHDAGVLVRLGLLLLVLSAPFALVGVVTASGDGHRGDGRRDAGEVGEPQDL